MRTRTLIIIGVVLIQAPGLAHGGYRDLVRAVDAYAPPAMHRPQAARSPLKSTIPDAFEKEMQSMNTARNRWQDAIDHRIRPVDVEPLADTAADDGRTLAILQDRFSLQALRALVMLRNPSINAAAARAKAALEGFDQVAQLDDILRQYSAFTDGGMAGVGPMRGGSDAIRMKFPFPGITALKGQVADKNVDVATRNFEIVRRDIVARASKAYWNLLFTHRALRITRDTLDRLNHLDSVATTRYGAGKTSYQDVVKIRIGREKLSEQLNTLKQQRVNLETELLSLMDLEPGPLLGWTMTTTPDTTLPVLAELYPIARAKRQELNRLRAMIAKMERMVEMAETMIQPAFSENYALYTDNAVLQAGSAGMQPAFGTTVSPTRGKGLPKNAWFGSRDAYLRETRRKLDAQRMALADAEARTRLMVRTGWFDLDRARRENDLYKNRLLSLAQTSLDVSTRGYESGKVSFADVIASYTGWLEVNLASERRNSDLGIARVELERRIGTRLSKKPEDSRSGVARGLQ